MRDISSLDIKYIYTRARRFIFSLSFLAAALVALLLASGGIRYKATAQFLDLKTPKESVAMSQISELLDLAPPESKGAAVMLSRPLLEKVVRKLYLQCQVTPQIKVNEALLALRADLGFLVDEEPYYIVQAEQRGRYRKTYKAEALSNIECIIDGERKAISEPLLFEEGSVTFSAFPEEDFELLLLPMDDAIDALLKRLTIKADKKDKQVINLSCKHPNRKIAMAILDAIMSEYSAYLKDEGEALAKAQHAYLEKRRLALLSEMETLLNDHRNHLEKEIGERGFLELGDELKELLGQKESLLKEKRSKEALLHQLEKSEYPLGDYALSMVRELSELKQKTPRAPVDFRGDDIPRTGLDLNATKAMYARCVQERAEIEEEIEALNKKQIAHLSDPISMKYRDSLRSLREKLDDSENYTSLDLSRTQVELTRAQKGLDEHISALLSRAKEKHASFSKRLHLLFNEQNSLMLEKSLQLEEQLKKLKNKEMSECKQELLFYEKSLSALNEQLKSVPDKWLFERKLHLDTELSGNIVRSISELLETNSIQNNLSLIQSKSLGPAYAKSKPFPPLILAAAISTFVLFAICAFFIVIAKTMGRGIPYTIDHLKREKKYPICGKLSRKITNGIAIESVRDEAKRPLRALSSFIDPHKTVLLIASKGPSYGHAFCQLLAKKEKKILLVQASFLSLVQTTDVPGLSQYLSNDVEECPIRHMDGYDYIPVGEKCDFGPEIFSGAPFALFLDSMKNRYDQIILFSKAKPESSEPLALLLYADSACISMQEESEDVLDPYFEWAASNYLTFLTF